MKLRVAAAALLLIAACWTACWLDECEQEYQRNRDQL